MKILLYNPDNGVTRNFMPHLWMFLLQAITPPEHEVLLVDGNARAMNEEELVRFVREQQIDLVGIGAMTRMIAKAYRMADAIRAAGVPVVMGGPHVTEVPDEALGRDGGPRHADAIALGEADETWPQIVADAARGELKEVYKPVDEKGLERKPSLQLYPSIPWETLDLNQFNLVPKIARPLLERMGSGWGTFRVIPIESGRGCPYGCEFCTVTGFFGDSIRFRSNESVVEELLRLKKRARQDGGQIAVFFIDDNFAINKKRTKSLLRDMIAANAQLPWVAQISANLLGDEELVDLIARSGGKWIFIGMESVDPANLADVNKNFNKPGDYAAVLNRLAERDVYAITSFIFGMDNDTPGVAARTLAQIHTWAPGLPVFGQLTPFPATPLYDRLAAAGRLTRPKHWMDFAPFEMAHTPLKMTIKEARTEVDLAWRASYSPERNREALESISDRPVEYRIGHLIARLFFRGIYFPQMNKRAWFKLIAQNRGTIYQLVREGVSKYRAARRRRISLEVTRVP
ncbi:MAG: B12-binding domain-containing radical SAM protein [Pyrinomonadaceae bacterium]|nr:B12-binding domain-containing radical SAM protein [Pyrinomonadaceae bacterium]MDQ3584897.1 B12-binding domain-containing radical SAM protein [Acidobacteriota bacterium]